MLAFIDEIVIPFLNTLYGAVGYVGVMLAMAIESAMIPLPSELILPYAGFLVSDPTQIEPITGQPWNFWIVVVVATIGNTLGSLVAYGIGAYGGRPLLERYGRYVLIRPHEIDLADEFFAKHGVGDGLHRPAAADRPDVHQLPRRRGPDAPRQVHRLFDRRRVHLVDAAGLRRARCSARTGRRSATRSSRSTSRSRSASSRWSCCSSGGASGCRASRAARRPDAARLDGQPRRRSSGGRTLRKSRYISRS